MPKKITIKSDIIKESYQIIDTSCGLKIGCYTMPLHDGVHAVFATSFGSIDTKFTMDSQEYTIPAGVAHFLEHKMFEDEDGDAFEKFAKTGANANAFTSFDKTCYVFTATENIDKALDVLLSFVTKPYFTKETVEKEQGIIGQEIKMYDDNSGWRALFGVLEGLYKVHTIKDDIAGTVESISQITPEMLYTCAKAFYSPSKMFLSVAGNITPEQVINAVERANLSSESFTVERAKQNEPCDVQYKEKSITMPISIPLVAIGFKENFDFPIDVKKELIGDIIMDILAGSTSELFNSLYDKNIVNGTFEGEIFCGTDYYAEIISGETNEPQTLLREIEIAIEHLKSQGVTQDQFYTTKNAMYGGMIVEFENVEEVATNLVTAYFKDTTVFKPLEILSEITLDDVNNQLKTMFNLEYRTVFTILPNEELDDDK